MMRETIKNILLLIVAAWTVAAVSSCSPESDDPVPDPPAENIPDEEDSEEEPVVPEIPEIPEVPEVPEVDVDTKAIAGTWHLTLWSGSEPSFQVYMSITEEGSLTLWQRIDSYSWEVFSSVVNYENGMISGVYSDGVVWADSYIVSMEDDAMTWTSVYDSTDVSTYTRESLPEYLPVTD